MFLWKIPVSVVYKEHKKKRNPYFPSVAAIMFNLTDMLSLEMLVVI